MKEKIIKFNIRNSFNIECRAIGEEINKEVIIYIPIFNKITKKCDILEKKGVIKYVDIMTLCFGKNKNVEGYIIERVNSDTHSKTYLYALDFTMNLCDGIYRVTLNNTSIAKIIEEEK